MIERLVEAGIKGKVVSVNDEWSYAVMEFNDPFIGEIEAIQEIMKKNEIAGSVPRSNFSSSAARIPKPSFRRSAWFRSRSDDKLGSRISWSTGSNCPLNKGDVVFF